ncbi:Tol-Pal system beta propeller repeat protein TolB [Rubrivivax gelatinosus]|uniref:Tol-Pal system protein TolB n=1 Tax=Rubrivivax gelatinosus TaxID=28068 RepID=A0ABS1DTK0_RUBGE|nr:Tol-Pal system beta propeller repeat protein TolB [Rubrivivax gelatinosus]MBK1613282.1 Tol-Pal system beta propeller repeat protein TolB [Rubrivivax gelatinosus]MBK1713352.1 Tol-Pal system beta propeller repeat protein TolB [Rubrivivax gelatinosus]
MNIAFENRSSGLLWPRRRFLTALATAGAAFPAAAQFRIDVSGVGARQIPIAIAPFRDETQLPTPISGIVGADLARSGMFRVNGSPVALDERSVVAAPEWRARGVDAVVAGSVSRLADGRLDIRFALWDIVKGQQLVSQGKLVLAADLRLTAHRISDAIYEALTGERGVNATRIVYVVKAGRRFTLNVTDADGEGGQIALASPEPIISPAWAPDGRELAYVSFETQKAVVWVQDLITGSRRKLADFRGSNSAPAWSPDGRELAVTLSRDGGSQLYTISRAGGAPRRLTSSLSIDTEPVYAPDGRSIFFVSDRGGGPQVYRLPLDGGGPQRVTFSGNYNISPAVSPDGKTLAYVTRQGDGFKLMTLDLDAGGGVRMLSDTRDDESPSFAPNGKLIVYATRQQGRDVLMTTTLDGSFKTRLVTSGADMREPAWGPFER